MLTMVDVFQDNQDVMLLPELVFPARQTLTAQPSLLTVTTMVFVTIAGSLELPHARPWMDLQPPLVQI